VTSPSAVDQAQQARALCTAMLRGALVPSGWAGAMACVALWATRQAPGGGAALLGLAVALAFFAPGLLVMRRIVSEHPLSLVAAALAVFLGQLVFLGVVILSLSGAPWLDGFSFGVTVLVVALVWQVSQVLAFVRMRKPVFTADAPGGTRP